MTFLFFCWALNISLATFSGLFVKNSGNIDVQSFCFYKTRLYSKNMNVEFK